MGVLLSSRDRGTGNNWGWMNAAKYWNILKENLHQSACKLRMGWQFTFQHNNDPKPTSKTTLVWLWCKSLNVLEWPTQSPRLKPIKHLWRDLKMSVHSCLPSNLMELERTCHEEWDKLPKSSCAELIEMYPRRLVALIAANGASTNCW